MSAEGQQTGFQAGIELEHALSKALVRAGIPHELTRGNDENLDERVDLRVFRPPFDPGPAFEFQLTLREHVKRKMVEFAVAALRNTRRGIRIYLEILGNRRDKIAHMAERVVYAIKSIMRDHTHFGPHNLIGFRVRIGRAKRSPKLERFDLLYIVGTAVREFFEAELRREKAQRLRDTRAFLQLMKQRNMSRTPTLPGPPRLFPMNKRERLPVLSPHIPRSEILLPRRLP